jgi:two-component system heavy metal sensor histidine kinase CusS
LVSNLEEYDRIARMIDSLLFLARAENPKFQVAREDFDVRTELEELLDFYEGLASDGGVTLKLEAPAGMKAHLEKTLFLRAVGNLVLNAIRYTGAINGREKSVVTRVRKAGDFLEIEVQDTGCGIAESDIPRLFERFYRADPSRAVASGGMGLGLSIVKTITDVHDGRVEVESELGRGTQFLISFLNR